MFDAAKLAGLFIVLRPGVFPRSNKCIAQSTYIYINSPGPYINAETTAGGLALWSLVLTNSTLRTNASDIEHAWMPYIRSIIDQTNPNQVSEGGPVIAVQIGKCNGNIQMLSAHSTSDNEYNGFPPGGAEYFQQLEQTYRDNGIVVPLCVHRLIIFIVAYMPLQDVQ